MTNPTYAVIGSGYMGGGIAQSLALSGVDVRIADVSLDIAVANRERLIAEAECFSADGLFPEEAADLIGERVVAATVEDAVDGATFIEEAVPEKIEIKHETLRRVSRAADADAIIGSNTSTILISRIAEAVERPERFLGVHFSNPAPFIPGVELIPHAGTDEAILPVVEAIVAATGKQTARIKDATGFVLNRRRNWWRRAWPVRRTSTRSCARRSASGCRSSAPSRSRTWPVSMCMPSATRRSKRAGRSVSRRLSRWPSWSRRASSARRAVRDTSTSRPSARPNSSRTATRRTWRCRSSSTSSARRRSAD
jgi:fructose-specific component phosphotransferase system IIB-like protein